MWQFEVQHGVEGEEEGTEVLVRGGAQVGVDQMNGGQLGVGRGKKKETQERLLGLREGGVSWGG